ncbi:hypothetical protein [Hathewaya limosa]|nr:hypothetical protein [Hathewaya limosa]
MKGKLLELYLEDVSVGLKHFLGAVKGFSFLETNNEEMRGLII